MTNTLAMSVAKRFIDLSIQDQQPITPMKLYKLTYIAHGWSLGLRNKPLFIDEIQAWKYGPVIPTIEKLYSSFRDKNISSAVLPPEYVAIPELDEDDTELVKAVWQGYKEFSALALSASTHEKGTPWDKVWNHEGGKSAWPYEKIRISDELIKSHYDEIIQKRSSEQTNNGEHGTH